LGENALFEPSTIEIGSPIRPVEVSKNIIGKERKAIHQKSQKLYVSRFRGGGGGTPGAIVMKFGTGVLMINVIYSEFCPV
jgi:hypothetical protein